MADLTNLQLLTLAQTAQRLGISRGSAFREVRGRGVTRARWIEVWAQARDVERLFPPLRTTGPGAP